MGGHLERLSEFLVSVGYEDLPDPVRVRARQVLADTLAAVVGGSAEPEVQALGGEMLRDASGTASVLGFDRRAAPATAAFLNGTAGTFLEMDEGNQFCRGHPGIHAVPAALAHAESAGCSGSDFMLAMVLGYEVGARIGIGAELRMSMHPHGTWGTVGAAVAVARLAGADAAQMRETINVASTLGLGTSRQTMLQGGTVRNSFAGFSGQIGLMAWDMVRAGFTGERDGLATVWGSVLSESWDPGALTEALGERWEIARNYFKRHACCRYNHAALDALAQIRAGRPIAPDEVASVDVHTYSLAAQLRDDEPRNTLAGKFSVPFAIASTLVHSGSGLASFTREALGNEWARGLARRVRVHEEPAFTAMMPARRPARVIVHLVDGTRLEASTETNRGDFEDPYEQAELTEKFFELCGRVWPDPLARAVFDRAMHVDRLLDMNDLTKGVHQRGPPT